ncbi:MAG: TetR/AcrR family transcriptional regulator, partial [Lachnospiraceae bacterium]|nr:TetR/AcrR family transcriptional regulator [Lachnospiraceae bacterium]
MQDTKETILMVSLELFSQRGFSAVSIRDICKKVNIKESSIYYHFQNKRAILEELLQRFQNTATTMMSRLESMLNDTNGSHNIGSHDIIGNYFFEQYLMDDFCNKVIRLLLIEQFHNEEVQKIYDHWIFAKPLAFQNKVFSALMEMKIIKHTDSYYVAEKYYAPIFLFAQRWLFCGPLTDEHKQSFR